MGWSAKALRHACPAMPVEQLFNAEYELPELKEAGCKVWYLLTYLPTYLPT